MRGCLLRSIYQKLFPAFDDRAHVLPVMTDPVPFASPVAGLDIGWASPSVLLQGGFSPAGDLVVLREFAQERWRLPMFLRAARKHAGMLPGTVGLEVAAFSAMPPLGVRSSDFLEAAGWHPCGVPARPSVRVKFLRRLLGSREFGPRLMVHHSCADLVAALRECRGGIAADGTVAFGTPELSHWIDALGYMACCPVYLGAGS